jgi:site-specific DNA recombinase
MRAALYARKSQANEEAVAGQLANARAFAAAKGFTVVREFTDDGISGAEFLARPGFAALLAAVKATPRPFDVVITMHVDRVGREAYRTNIALLDIAEAGCRIFTYADGQEVKLDSPLAKQMLSMRNYAAEDFRQQIADKTREKMRLKARAGHVTGTRTFGYDHLAVGDHLERQINAQEAPVVVRIFEMAAEGYGNRRIMNTLRDEHVPAPGKKGWSKTGIKALLRNKLYLGVLEFAKSRAAARGGAASKRAAVTMDDWVVVPLPGLQIVTDELWAKVQQRKAVTRQHYLRAPDGNRRGKPEAGLIASSMLNGIARCGVCGGALSYNGGKSGQRSVRRYYCTSRNRRGVCTNGRGVPMSALDEAVRGQIDQMLTDEETVWQLCVERTERWKREHARPAAERANLEREVTKLETIVARLTDAIENGEPVGTRLKERAAELAGLKKKRSEAVPLDLDRNTVHDGLVRVRSYLGGSYRLIDDPKLDYIIVEDDHLIGPLSRGTNAQVRQVLRTLGVERVVVTPDGDGWTVQCRADLVRLLHKGSAPLPPIPPRLPASVVLSIQERRQSRRSKRVFGARR